jgi:hypothetical protein
VPASIFAPCDGEFHVEWTCGGLPYVDSIELPLGAELSTASLYY